MGYRWLWIHACVSVMSDYRLFPVEWDNRNILLECLSRVGCCKIWLKSDLQEERELLDIVCVH